MESIGLAEAILRLKKRGYTEDFNLRENCLECQQGKFKVFENEFKVDATYRFDEVSDPSDQAILYAISSEKNGLKGTLVNSFGIYSDSGANAIVAALVRGEREASDSESL